ncbi:acetolactate synthase small subunit [Desulfosarcina ovata]|uniref:Acetolactate synthase small subunit n=2 Tax=Desulfosarcina ovata TaxID=83564 RepID=A0A5K8A3F9_9BACT|nr:acetolactate synthase small subunit [Desulfosarcina ovata]BBO80377.1 acetolactate synthase small subunit [Desulfosarcina ovata subsp. sediminis]BBO87085.1 acetolactate synthase small subunit [Desulfosarcina ovata subsp. ovata]
MQTEKYTITMLVENEPGVTARVTGLFASRGYNIETICGAPTANPEMSRITITTNASPEQVEQIMKQVRRLVNVIKVRDMTGDDAVRREMAMICVKAQEPHRAEIQRIVENFRARVVDTGQSHYIIEATGSMEKIGALLRLLEPMGIKKVARSGILALYREPG